MPAPRGFEPVEIWLGFSTDEIGRVNEPRNAWSVHRFPLLELDMSRADCLDWWHQHAPSDAPPLHKSSCVGCPYHSRVSWVDLQRRHPDLVAEAAAVEADMNAGEHPAQYLHARTVPLAEAVAADVRQQDNLDAQGVLDLFGDGVDGCEGASCWT